MIQQSQIAIVACETRFHREMAEFVIRRGLDCLIEKPATGEKSDCIEILRLSSIYGVQVAVGYIERFNPALTASNQFITSSPPLTKARFCRMNPSSSRNKGKSIITDLMIHDIDIAINLLDLKPRNAPILVAKLPDHGDPDYVVIGYTSQCNVQVEFCASRLPGPSVREIHLSSPDIDIRVDMLRRKFDCTSIDGASHRISGDAQADALQHQLREFLDFRRRLAPARLATLSDAIKTLDFCQSVVD